MLSGIDGQATDTRKRIPTEIPTFFRSDDFDEPKLFADDIHLVAGDILRLSWAYAKLHEAECEEGHDPMAVADIGMIFMKVIADYAKRMRAASQDVRCEALMPAS